MNAAGEVCIDASLAIKVVVAEPDSDKADALFAHFADQGARLIAPVFSLSRPTAYCARRL
jgi:hypothetical protein